MKKQMVSLLLILSLILTLGLSACSKAAEEAQPAETEPVSLEPVIADYLAAEVGKDYDKADACIPTVYVVGTEEAENGDVTVYGDFWVENFDLKDDTLECVSGGHYPGVMQLKKDGDTYSVAKFDVPEDGADFDASAKKLFGKFYDAWQKYSSDDAARKKQRTKAIADYVKANDLDVTQYQDYGWDPVALPTK